MYEIKQLTEYGRTLLPRKLINIIGNAPFYVEDEWGEKLYGFWNRKDIEKYAKTNKSLV